MWLQQRDRQLVAFIESAEPNEGFGPTAALLDTIQPRRAAG
jgi:hypothetical protein